jgi:RNA polymerase sigma-70 factor (ECF subfamily)
MHDKQQQFVRLIQANEKIIFKVLAIYANEGTSKKDLYQEILLQLWTAFGSFQQKSKVSTWVYRIALNTAVTQFRKSKRNFAKTGLDESVFQIADIVDETENEQLQQLYQQINKLNQLDKALVLLYLENKSYAEIAEITGLSVTNVGSRLSRIKEKMKKEVN